MKNEAPTPRILWMIQLLAALLFTSTLSISYAPEMRAVELSSPDTSNLQTHPLIDSAALSQDIGFIPWIGERIDYHVAFGVIPAGKARMQVLDTVRINGHLTLHAMSSAQSARAFDIVFKVRDTVETWFDADSIYAVKFRKKLHEGKYRDEKVVSYELEDSLVRWSDDGKEKPTQRVEPRVQDVLSAGFKARLLPFAVGDTFSIKTHDVDKLYELMVIVHARETIETLAGRFDCYCVEPLLRSGGLFQKEKSARVLLWVTADERRIPVKMQSKVSFGAITATMESYTPPLSR